jgi:hypothetical protein
MPAELLVSFPGGAGHVLGPHDGVRDALLLCSCCAPGGASEPSGLLGHLQQFRGQAGAWGLQVVRWRRGRGCFFEGTFPRVLRAFRRSSRCVPMRVRGRTKVEPGTSRSGLDPVARARCSWSMSRCRCAVVGRRACPVGPGLSPFFRALPGSRAGRSSAQRRSCPCLPAQRLRWDFGRRACRVRGGWCRGLLGAQLVPRELLTEGVSRLWWALAGAGEP